MIPVALVCVPVIVSGHCVTRLEGALVMVACIAYLTCLVLTPTSAIRGAFAEVLIPNVATSADRGLIVGGKRLVVHASVQLEEIRKVTNRARFANHKWIEQPNFDIGMKVERGELRVDPGYAMIVQ